jgi:hypothetical protein
LIGAFATNYLIKPRFTVDMDVLIAANLKNAWRLAAGLNDFGFSSHGLMPEEFSDPVAFIQLGRPPYRIEICNRISGFSNEAAWAGVVDFVLDGFPSEFWDANSGFRTSWLPGTTRIASTSGT